MAGDIPAPVIIKRKKVISGGGHHGGAWKVAYADFVTAMMAFFMLMWLLNATTEKQRKGIADYFNPTIPVNRISGGGEGMFGGTNIFSEEVLARSGTGGLQSRSMASDAAEEESEKLKALSDVLLGFGGESDVAEQLGRHVTTRVTDEGLLVDLYDSPDAAVFEPDSSTLTPLGEQLIGVVATVFGYVTNGVTITGHTATEPVVVRQKTSWALSIDRAQVARVAMTGRGFPENRIREVGGQADREPFRAPAAAAQNNRLRIVLLRSSG
ncbi:flagellar motor protein MotB [Tropicimonas sp. S265A]|uniref:flagellar motor protein MotB n=1 Tax=Tropicimonas sp. S265A TaxID=3415134 RepID=UPI003C7E49C7